jgi:hypothetical protein
LIHEEELLLNVSRILSPMAMMLLDDVCYSGCQGPVHENCTSGVFMATFVQDVRLD